VFTTTPQIIADKLVPLTDPKNLFAARTSSRSSTSPPSPRHHRNAQRRRRQADHQRPARLDVKVITDKQDYTTAAQQWLQSAGLG